MVWARRMLNWGGYESAVTHGKERSMLQLIWAWLTPDKVIAVATIIYALVTMVMFFAIRSQSRAAQRQADIADIAAQAAKESADALINSERAWVLVDIRWDDRTMMKLITAQTEGTGAIRDCTNAQIKCVCVNHGKSPAWITVKQVGIAILETIPQEPDFSHMSVGQYEPEPLAPSAESTRYWQPGCEGNKGTGKIMIIYGIVQYKDIFSRLRETRFGYVLNPAEELERIPGAAYAAYNSYT
jgi:hypothetical protein